MTKRALALMIVVSCSKGSVTPIHELRFRGEGKVIAAAPNGGAVIAGGFADRTDLGAGPLAAGDDSVHGVVARIDRDGRVMWDAMLGGPFVHGLAADGDDVLLVAEAMPENRAWRIGPGGGEKWSVPFGDATPHASAWSDDGTLYVVGQKGLIDPSSGALGLAPTEGRYVWLAAIDRGGAVRWAKWLEPTSELRFAESVAVAGGRVFVISIVAQDLIADAYDRGGARVATRTLHVDGTNASIRPLGDGVVIATLPGTLIALDRALATRWERALPVMIHGLAVGSDGIFVGGSAFAFEWNGTTYPQPEDDKSSYAYVARLSPDGELGWISVGRGTGGALTEALAASGDVVWAAGAFQGPIVFGLADPLRGEPDGIQSGFAVELNQTR